MDPFEEWIGVFSNASGVVWVADLSGDPKRGDWTGYSYSPRRTRLPPDANLYFCISALQPGAARRRKSAFQALRVLVLDDIGTKVERTKVPLRPTYRIETSPRMSSGDLS